MLNRTCIAFFNCILLYVSFGCHSLKAELITLFDGNGLPANQPWLSYATTGGTATQTGQTTGVRLVTDLAASAGYSNYTPLGALKNGTFPSLNRANGFELTFNLTVSSENHSNNNRAGFSVSLIGSDVRGIELGFWGNQIWAQESSPLFTHGETIDFDTTLQRDYRLRVQDNSYALFSGGNQLLTGSIRNYTAFGSPPYTLPNFLFLGDNTTSAGADITLGAITLQSDLTAVPEPSSLFFLLATSILILCRKVVFRPRFSC
jgi:hypothetical protein